uniref:tRNA(Ile)-lysidine synthetase n=1 Tax=Psilocybe cubensis TaxID=181762 RepID=A0A8H8CNN8_PSICU
MAARIIHPISALEFAHMVRKCMPPVGWSDTIGIANSGGPDSTCLMFLFNRLINDTKTMNADESLPKNIVSLTIDHDLQASSADMATHASRIAQSLGVRHITKKLDWKRSRPGPGDSIEELARDKRYDTLLDLIIACNANSLAMGHHCDDQVETMLMRLGRSSTKVGLGGMRPCRRWGMGNEIKGVPNRQLQVEQMRRWIVRPLLSVGKDRILATCEENKLEYVSDPTNFQPQLTIRNAIRHVISNEVRDDLDYPSFPHIINLQLKQINATAAKDFNGAFDLTSGIDHLRKVSMDMSSAVEKMDLRVNEMIPKCRIPSSPGTFMISAEALSKIPSPDLREALLYRIVRYVSPEPWGSPKAELGRRKVGMLRLWEHLSSYKQHLSRNNSSICVGSGVWWRLVTTVNGRLRSEVRNVDPSNLAWIALRQPPSRSIRVPNYARFDITRTVLDTRNTWLTQSKSPLSEMVFDNRFLLQFSVDKMPTSLVKLLEQGALLVVEPRGIWRIPEVKLHNVNGLARKLVHTEVKHGPFSVDLELGSETYIKLDSGWITMEYFRPISAI